MLLVVGLALVSAGCGNGSDGSAAPASATGDPSATPSPSDSVATDASFPSTSPSTTSSETTAPAAEAAHLRLVLDRTDDDADYGFRFSLTVTNNGDAPFDGHVRVDGSRGASVGDETGKPYPRSSGPTFDLGRVHLGPGTRKVFALTATFDGEDGRKDSLTARAGGHRSSTYSVTVFPVSFRDVTDCELHGGDSCVVRFTLVNGLGHDLPDVHVQWHNEDWGVAEHPATKPSTKYWVIDGERRDDGPIDLTLRPGATSFAVHLDGVRRDDDLYANARPGYAIAVTGSKETPTLFVIR